MGNVLHTDSGTATGPGVAQALLSLLTAAGSWRKGPDETQPSLQVTHMV